MAKISKPSRSTASTPVAAIVLAAGDSKRFKSRTPKVLHTLCGRPMLQFVLDAVGAVRPQKIVVVAGRDADRIATLATPVKTVSVVVQKQRLGTADAARVGDDALGAAFRGLVLVTPGDTPLLDAAMLRALVKRHRATGAAATVLTARFDDPTGYGRILRAPNGSVARIVEHGDASADERAIDECNAGVYVFDRVLLRSALTRVEGGNKQKELYLTDVIQILADKGERIDAFLAADAVHTLGINDRAQLAGASAILRERINTEHMLSGVTIEDPATTYIDAGVRIGGDTTIRPLTFLRGDTVIGSGCVVGPNAELIDCRLGDDVTISQAVAKQTVLGEGASVGPFASLRPGSVLKQSAKAGTFVELKKTVVGKGSKVPHLSYMGDTTIGRDSNVGAGTISCNYDGETKIKSKTVIGDGVLIGSDTMLIAPVKLGNRAVTGAASVVTRDVKANQVVVGAPAKPKRNRKAAPAPKTSRTTTTKPKPKR